jgi:hypothetical protein
LPGYQLVLRNCMTCHSAQYVATQPPSSPRGYWEATVKKMKKPFGAQFAKEDVPAMVEYLVKTYGAERTSAAALQTSNNCLAGHAVDQHRGGDQVGSGLDLPPIKIFS